MKPGENPPDSTQAPIDTQGWQLCIPAHALAGKTSAEIRAMIETAVTVLEDDNKIPYMEWIAANVSESRPPETPEPGALVHREIYGFRDELWRK